MRTPPTVMLRTFARYRDLLGFDTRTAPLPDPPTVSALLAAEGLTLPPEAMVAVNQGYGTRATVLRDGDDVAFLPPVSGG